MRDHFQISNNAVIAPDAQEPAPVVTALNRRSAQGEDCLTVNVFTPALDNTPRPVMVWMHGGGFSAGAGNYLLYDGTNLAKKEDVVVVVVNHRLNVFGFLHLADIGGDQWAQATNVGVQDLVATVGMGSRQHRELWRRPGQGHNLRSVRRRRQDNDAHGHALRRRACFTGQSRRAARASEACPGPTRAKRPSASSASSGFATTSSIVCRP